MFAGALGSLDAAGVKGLHLAFYIDIAIFIFGLVAIFSTDALYRLSWPTRLTVFTIFIILDASAVAGFATIEYKYFTDTITLVPANYALKLNSCDPNSENYSVILGTSPDEISHFPTDLITMDGRPLVQLSLRRDGNISISRLTLYDDRHDVIATVTDDVFWTRNDIRRVRPNPYTLLVYDHNDDLALGLVYLNPKVIEIAGIFRNKSFPMIVRHGPDGNITFLRKTGGPVVISRSCLGDLRVEQTDKVMKFGNIVVEE